MKILGIHIGRAEPETCENTGFHDFQPRYDMLWSDPDQKHLNSLYVRDICINWAIRHEVCERPSSGVL